MLAVEDLYRVDKSSEDAFKTSLESISGLRVFIIFTYCLQYVHTWGTWTYHSQLNLNCFSNRECLSMVHHSFGTDIIEETLEELILEKTKGPGWFTTSHLQKRLSFGWSCRCWTRHTGHCLGIQSDPDHHGATRPFSYPVNASAFFHFVSPGQAFQFPPTSPSFALIDAVLVFILSTFEAPHHVEHFLLPRTRL